MVEEFLGLEVLVGDVLDLLGLEGHCDEGLVVFLGDLFEGFLEVLDLGVVVGNLICLLLLQSIYLGFMLSLQPIDILLKILLRLF